MSTPRPHNRLWRRRVELGLTQERLAAAVVANAARRGQRLSLSASAISRWESGTFEPSLRYRPHLATVLGVPVCELFPVPPITTEENR